MIANHQLVPFHVSVVRSGRRAVVRLAGELDFASAPELERVLDDVFADDRPLVVVVDAGQLSFADVVGAGLIIDSADRLAPDGRLEVRNAGPQLVQVLTVLDRVDLLG